MRTEAELADWLRQHLDRGGARGFVVGLSGGIDSAVVVRLCQLAAPGNTLGVIMPCHSEPVDQQDALLVAEHFHVPVARIDLSSAHDDLLNTAADATAMLRLQPDARPSRVEDIRARVPAANLKPRLRMATLYYLANSLNYLVAGTGNRSELSIGYFTKYGDGGTDVLPIGHLLKSEVRALAAEIGVPQRIIEKAPSAGLWPGQTDEAEMGFTYRELEAYLRRGPSGVEAALAERLDRLVRSTEHKRRMPPVPETVG